MRINFDNIREANSQVIDLSQLTFFKNNSPDDENFRKELNNIEDPYKADNFIKVIASPSPDKSLVLPIPYESRNLVTTVISGEIPLMNLKLPTLMKYNHLIPVNLFDSYGKDLSEISVPIAPE